MLSQHLSPHIKSVVSSYLNVLNEITGIDEAASAIVSSSLFFRTLCDVLHCKDLSLIRETVAMISQKCEDVEGSADIVAQYFCGEDTSYSSKFNESTLSILMSILSSSAEVDLKMTILKFLAVLVYSAKTLSKKVAVHFVLSMLILSS